MLVPRLWPLGSYSDESALQILRVFARFNCFRGFKEAFVFLGIVRLGLRFARHEGLLRLNNDTTKELVVSLLKGTPSAVFATGRKIILTINRDGSVGIEYEPGLRASHPAAGPRDSQVSRFHNFSNPESSGR